MIKSADHQTLRKTNFKMRTLNAFSFVLFLIPLVAEGCHPGRGGIRRRGARKLTPLVFKQHEPNFSERSLAASGLPEGPVDRTNERFRRLVPNYNPDIVFKDEEGTGADRIMTQRCKEKLNTLSISVMNQWPGLHLRVTEGWDEDGHHSQHSLHYEGRAVDVTTSDRDRRKYGMLARLAVEAGFDWVYYESRSHVHASCKSEADSPEKAGGGCFSGSAFVTASDGRRLRMRDVKPGMELLTVDPADGSLAFSKVLMFLDRDVNETRRFVTLSTEDGRDLTLTPTHLIYAYREEYGESSNFVSESEFEVVYAGDVKPGDRLLTKSSNGEMRSSVVAAVSSSVQRGVYAPLTESGNILVDDVLASCYAVVDSQRVAHAAFWPLRLYHKWFGEKQEKMTASSDQSSGVHWYAEKLYSLGKHLMPNHLR